LKETNLALLDCVLVNHVDVFISDACKYNPNIVTTATLNFEQVVRNIRLKVLVLKDHLKSFFKAEFLVVHDFQFVDI
jgi:hypothetical protein